jgi:hypothetical protein
MATDYDAPRKTDEEIAAESLETLQATAAASAKSNSAVDVDETELAESLELPGADLSDHSLEVYVVPVQSDEFTCTRCFLVHHHSQRAEQAGEAICLDCAA